MPARTTTPLPVPPNTPSVRSVEVRRQGVVIVLDGQEFLLEPIQAERLCSDLSDILDY